MANEFIIRKGYKSLASSEITGSLSVSGSNISIVGADTPFLNIKDTTNDLTGKIRVANSYVYFEADQGNSVGSTRLVLKTDGTQFLYGDANQNVFIPTGDVGIGTTTASHMLTVRGPVSASAYYGDGSNLSGISVSTPTLDQVTDQGSTTTNSIQVSKLIASQSAYTDGVVFKRAGHDEYRITLGNSEGLRIVNQTDSAREEFKFSGAGDATFTGNVTVSGTGLSTIANQLYVGQTSDYFGSNTNIQLNSGGSTKSVGIRSQILYLYSHGNNTTSKLIFGDGSANFGLFSNDTEFALYNYGTSSNSLLVNRSNNYTTFAGNVQVNTAFKVNAPDGGSSPAMTAVIDMHGYDGRGVGIKMKDNVTTSGGGTDREWFVGTGYNSTGFNIGYASDGSQSSYAAQSKLSITTGGLATFASRVGIGITASTNAMLDVKGPDTDNAVLGRFYSNTGARGSFIIRNGSGTNPTTFIGTAGGSEQLSIGTNNTEAIRIDAASTPNTTFAGNVNVGANQAGKNLYVYGVGNGEGMFWDAAQSHLTIKHDDGDLGLEIYPVSSTTPSAIQLKVGRDSGQYWGVYTTDRDTFLIHRQDETDGQMRTNFDQWDSNTTDPNGEWRWRSGNGSGGSMTTALTLNKGGDATFAGSVTVAGTLTAQEFKTELISSSIVYESGSTKFGDTSDDIHSFSGSLRVTGSGDHYFTNGSVGIGTASPGTPLHVYSTEATIKLQSSHGREASLNQGGGNFHLHAAHGSGVGINYGNTSHPGLLKLYNNTTSKVQVNANGDSYFNGGSLGVGTTSPIFALHVNSSSTSNTSVGIGNTSSGVSRLYIDAGNGDFAGSDYMWLGQNNDLSGEIFMSQNAGSFHIKSQPGGTARTNVTVTQAGDVGIGSTSPEATLDVRGDGADFFLQSADFKIARIQPRGTGADLDRGLFSLFYGSTEKVRIDTAGNSWFNGGNVGIGEMSPWTKLGVEFANATTTQANMEGIIIANSNGTTNNGSAITFAHNAASGGSHSKIGAIYEDRSSSTEDTALFFGTIGAGAYGERMRITSTGKVGIGTNNPGDKLEVAGLTNYTGLTLKGTGASRPALTFKNVNQSLLGSIYGTEGRALTFEAGGDGTTGVVAMTIDSSGEVGIGISSPQTKLHVAGPNADASAATLRIGGPANGQGNNVSRLELVENTTNSNADMSYGFSFTADGNNTNNLLIKSHNNSIAGTTAVTVTRSDGNVGIGTTNPITKLQISAANATSPTANIFLDIDGSTTPGMGGQIIFGSSTSSTLTNYIATIQGVRNALDDGSSDIHFQTTHVSTATTPSRKMTIKSDGKVGIGTTSPSSVFHVNTGTGTGNANTVIIDRAGSSDYSGISFATAGTVDWSIGHNSAGNFEIFEDGQDAKTRVTVEATSGDVGIGSSSPGNKLDVMGNVSASAYYGDGSNLTGISADGGNATTLDGIDSTSFFRSDAADTAIGFSSTTSVNGSGDAGIQIVNGGRLGFDQSGTRSWTMKAAGGRLDFNSGDNGGSVYFGTDIVSNNKQITGLNNLAFGDPGPNEGIAWSGGNFKIYESPNDLTTNTAGNLQFVSGSTRVLSIGKKGETALEVIGSGSTVFEVVGSQGQLFSVTDDLTGTLFAVSDISGTPLLEVDADSTITMGDFGTNALVVTGSNVGIGTATPAQKLHVVGSQVRLETAAGGYYLHNTSGAFRGAFHDNGTVTSIYADGDGSTAAISIDSGNSTFAGNISLADGKLLKFGASDDYQIYHNSTTNVNHIFSNLDRQLSLNANIINFTNQANDSTVMAVSGSRVKIGGTHAATHQLHIKNTSGDNRGLMVENSVAASYAEVALKSDTREFRLGTGGSGTSNANAQNLFYIYDATTGGAAGHRFEINSNGDVQARRERSNTVGEVALSLQPTDSTIHYGLRIDSTTNSFNLDRVDVGGQLLRVDTSGNATFTGYVKSPYYTSDGNGKFYAWRAIENTSNSSNLYYRIAKITGSQSTRFSIELTGRSTSYGDNQYTAWGKLVGQLNNDNNYDLTFYDFKTADSEVVTEIGQVDVGTTQTSIYVKIGQFAEIAATAYISDGSITTYDTNDGSTSAPSGYVAAARSMTMWHSGNDGAGSGLAADDADTLDGLHAVSFLRSDVSDVVNNGSTISFSTSAGNVRGYLQSTENTDEHFIIATSGGEAIAFKDGGTSGTTNLIIKGDGSMVQPAGKFINTVSSGNNIDLRKGDGSGAIGFGGTAHQTGLIEGVDGGGLKLYTAGNDVNWGGAWTLSTTWSGNDLSQAGRITGGEHIMAANNVYANGTQGFVFGQSVTEGEYIQRSGNDIQFVAGGSTRMTIDGDAGRVGIGTTNPQRTLEVIGPGNDYVSVGVAALSVGQFTGIHFGYRENNNNYRKSAIVFERTDLTSNDAQGKIHILNGPQGSSANASLSDAHLTVAENGSIGIGTTTPGAKLQVVGSGSTVLDIQGTQGQLFSITDDLTGDLFTVSDISGVPIFNVNASGEVEIDGKLGIGAAAGNFHADADNLVVGDGVGNTGITIHSGTTGFGSIFFADGTADDATEKRGQIRYLQGTERMDFHTDNVATAALSLAANSNATFGGTLDVGTFTLGGSGIIADSGMTLQTNAGGVNAITLTSAGAATFAGKVGMPSGFSTGKFAVMSSDIHASYDFYNNGTSYFNGNVIVNANLTVDAGNISLTADGANAVTFTESGNGLLTIQAPDDIILDCQSDIVLDANGADIRFKDNGTQVGAINMASSNLTISSTVSDKDIILEGNDGGTTIQMLKLDSSNGGSATFKDDIDVGGHIYGKSVNQAFSELYRFGGIYFTWDSDSYGTNIQHSITSTSDGSYGDNMTWNSYGKVRINFDSNNNDTGDFRIGHHGTGTSGTLLTLTSAGTLTVTGDVVAFSDERLKSDVKTLDGTKVYDMRGVSFTKDDKQGSGVIAQELEKVAPELVHEHDEYKSVAYGNLTGYLIEAVKDLKKEIEDLKGTINKLQSEK